MWEKLVRDRMLTGLGVAVVLGLFVLALLIIALTNPAG